VGRHCPAKPADKADDLLKTWRPAYGVQRCRRPVSVPSAAARVWLPTRSRSRCHPVMLADCEVGLAPGASAASSIPLTLCLSQVAFSRVAARPTHLGRQTCNRTSQSQLQQLRATVRHFACLNFLVSPAAHVPHVAASGHLQAGATPGLMVIMQAEEAVLDQVAAEETPVEAVETDAGSSTAAVCTSHMQPARSCFVICVSR
jgi:hypothetical protein